MGVTTSRNVLEGVALSEFPGVNSWFLATIAPDGTGLAMYTGFRLDRELTQAYGPSFLPTGEVIALFNPQTPFLGAAGENGLRRYEQGARGAVRAGRPPELCREQECAPRAPVPAGLRQRRSP